MPNGYLFRKHLEEDESLLRVVHKHWLLGVKALFWPSLLFLGVAFLLSIAPNPGTRIIVASVGVGIGVWWLRNFFDYYLDAWLVTDQGIIDIAWHGWFHRESSRILYSDIQGVSYEIKGVLGTLLRFGTVAIEKVSTGESISLEYVKSPRRVESLILRNSETYLHAKNLKDADQVKELLSALVAQHMQMKDLRGDEEE